MALGVPFQTILSTLAGLFDLTLNDESRLLARLRNMQRDGFPPGINVGRGVKIAYGIEQLTAVIFYHSMVDAGFPPDFAIRIHAVHSDEILRVAVQHDFAFTAPHSWPGPVSLMLVIEGSVLSPQVSSPHQRPLPGRLILKQLIEVHSDLDQLMASPSGVHLVDMAGTLGRALRIMVAAGHVTDEVVRQSIAESRQATTIGSKE